MVAAVILAALAATGCTSGNNVGSATTTVPATTAPTTPWSSGAGTGAAALSGVVVQTSDLPSGWAAQGASIPEGALTDVASQLANCLGVRDVTTDATDSTQAGPFTQGDQFIVSAAARFPNDTDVSTATGMLTNPKFAQCFDQIASGASYDGVTLQRTTTTVNPGRSSGPANVAGSFHVAFTGTYFSDQVQSAADVVLITGPKLLVTVVFTGVSGTVPAAVQSSVIAKVAGRAATG